MPATSGLYSFACFSPMEQWNFDRLSWFANSRKGDSYGKGKSKTRWSRSEGKR